MHGAACKVQGGNQICGGGATNARTAEAVRRKKKKKNSSGHSSAGTSPGKKVSPGVCARSSSGSLLLHPPVTSTASADPRLHVVGGDVAA
ncbi:hypothetical protein VZT92_017232 [Zoarces viviparus]|uniref:Uncharacterized protein n=1 Tax=Zoarces viviparus TaxID=48416 RepID=A0AAW1ERA5_ZOAVI